MKKIIFFLMSILFFFITILLFYYYSIYGLQSSWALNNGIKINFYRLEGDYRESVKKLEIVFLDGKKEIYEFASWHAGYGKVELRQSEDDDIVWLVCLDQEKYIGPSYNFKTRVFMDEYDSFLRFPPQLGVDTGLVIKKLTTWDRIKMRIIGK